MSLLPPDVTHTMQYWQVSLQALQVSALHPHFTTLLSPHSRLGQYSPSGCHSHNTIATSVTGSTTVECSTPPLYYTTVTQLKAVSVLPLWLSLTQYNIYKYHWKHYNRVLYTSTLLHYCHPTQGFVSTSSCCPSHNAIPVSVTGSTTIECSTPPLS